MLYNNVLKSPFIILSIQGYWCDENGLEMPPEDLAYMGIPGSSLSVCVIPDERARAEGFGVKQIDSFSWIRIDENGGKVEQVVIEDGQAAGNGLTEMQCTETGCSFQSILKADFFVQAGNIPTDEPSASPTSIPSAMPTMMLVTNFVRDGSYQYANYNNDMGIGECTPDRLGGTYSSFTFEGYPCKCTQLNGCWLLKNRDAI